MELARRIGDPELRDDTMAVIVQIWSRTDRAAAEEWLARPGVPEGVRRAAAMAEAGNPARQRPRARAQRNATGGAAAD
jgi:hypothetical protein